MTKAKDLKEFKRIGFIVSPDEHSRMKSLAHKEETTLTGICRGAFMKEVTRLEKKHAKRKASA